MLIRSLSETKVENHSTPAFFKEELKKERGGVVGKQLRQLAYDDKARLIAALLIQDEKTIAEYFLGSKSATADEFKLFIKEWQSTENNLSAITKNIIAHICQPPDELPEQKKVALDQKAVLLLQYAVCLIPDLQMPLLEKVRRCKQVCVQLKIEPKLLTKTGFNFRYIEPLEPLKVNQYSGDIEVSRYRVAISVSNLDYSDFILLTMGAIQAVFKDKDSEILALLNSVRRFYLSREYEKAIQALQHLAGTHIESSHPEFAKIILNRSRSELYEVTFSENHSRRFYENRLMQFYLGKPIDWTSIYRVASEIAPLFSEVRDMDSQYPHIKLRCVADGVRFFLKYNKDTLKEKYRQLKGDSIAYQHRSQARQKKRSTIFDEKTQKSISTSPATLSKNKGVMLATQLNFYPEAAHQIQQDRVADEYRFESKETQLLFGLRTVFAGALSGSTFELIPTLDMYIKELVDRSTLDADLNIFIKGLICDFVNRGFHSIYEVLDVFTQPDVKKILDDNHVQLDLSWSDDLLALASKDAQTYAEAVCLNRAKNEELCSVHYLITVSPKFKKVVVYRLLKNAIEQNNIDTFFQLVSSAPDLINLRDFMCAINENPALVVNSGMASNYKLLTKLLNEIPEIIDRQNFMSETLIHYAVHAKDLANAQLLLEKGAQIDIPNGARFFPFTDSIKDESDEEAVQRNRAMLRMFTRKVDAEKNFSANTLDILVNIPGTKHTVFHVFVFRHAVEMLKLLLKIYPEIPNVNLQNEHKVTPFELSYRKYAEEKSLVIKKKYLEMMTIFATHEVNHNKKKFDDKNIITFLLDRNAYEVIFMIVLRVKMINPAVLEKVDYKKLGDEFKVYLSKLASTQSRLKLVHMIMSAVSPLGQILRNKNAEPFIIEKSLQTIFKQDKHNVAIAKHMITLALPHATSAKELKEYLKIYEPDVLNLIFNTLQEMRSAESKSSPTCFAWDRSKLLLLQSEVKKLLVRVPLKVRSQTPTRIRLG